MSGSQRELDKRQQFYVTMVYLSLHVQHWEKEQHRLLKYVPKLLKIALPTMVSLPYVSFFFLTRAAKNQPNCPKG